MHQCLEALPFLLGGLEVLRLASIGGRLSWRECRRARSGGHDRLCHLSWLLGRAKQLFGLFSLGVLDLLEVEEANVRVTGEDPVAIVLKMPSGAVLVAVCPLTNLFAGNRIPHQRDICQICKALQHVQIGEFSDIVLRQDKRVQIG